MALAVIKKDMSMRHCLDGRSKALIYCAREIES